MEINDLSPYIRFCGRSELRGPFCMQRREIYDYELIFLEKGNMALNLDGKDYDCTEGDLILLRPGHPHSLSIADGSTVSQPHVHFDPVFLESRKRVSISFIPREAMSDEQKCWILPDDCLPKNIPPVFRLSSNQTICSLLFQLADCYARKDPYLQLEGRQLLLRMLLIIVRHFSSDASYMEAEECAANQMESIKEYIDHNYTHAITLDNLADLFMIEKCYLTRLFKQTYGISAIAYSRRIRMQQADILLRQGNNVTQVSQMLGFDSIYSFSRTFFKETGRRPSCCRK